MKVIRRTDELVNGLMLAILCGELAEGDILPSDQQLGSQHNVSRTVVREAFRILGAKGMIEAKPRIGTRVAPISGWALWDLEVLGCLAKTEYAAEFDPHLADMRAALEPALATRIAEAGLNLDAYFSAYEDAVPLTMNLCWEVMANCFVNASYDPTRNGTCPGKVKEFYLGFERENIKRRSPIYYPFL